MQDTWTRTGGQVKDYSTVWPANKSQLDICKYPERIHHVFLASSSGIFAPEVTDAALFAFFSAYSTCSGAIMWDQKTGRSRGSGFVSFRNQQGSRRHTDGSLNQAGRRCHCRIGSATVNLLHTIHIHSS